MFFVNETLYCCNSGTIVNPIYYVISFSVRFQDPPPPHHFAHAPAAWKIQTHDVSLLCQEEHTESITNALQFIECSCCLSVDVCKKFLQQAGPSYRDRTVFEFCAAMAILREQLLDEVEFTLKSESKWHCMGRKVVRNVPFRRYSYISSCFYLCIYFRSPCIPYNNIHYVVIRYRVEWVVLC